MAFCYTARRRGSLTKGQNWKELDNFAVTLKWQNTMNKIEKAPQVSLEEMVKTMLEEKHPELVDQRISNLGRLFK